MENWFLAEMHLSSCGELTQNIIPFADENESEYRITIDIAMDRKVFKQKYTRRNSLMAKQRDFSPLI